MEGCNFLLLEIMVSQFTNLHEVYQRLESRPQWSQEAGFLPGPPLPTLGLPLDTFTVPAPHHYLICHLGQQKPVPTEAFRCDNSCQGQRLTIHLSKSPSQKPALLFMAWWHCCQWWNPDTTAAVSYRIGCSHMQASVSLPCDVYMTASSNDVLLYPYTL